MAKTIPPKASKKTKTKALPTQDSPMSKSKKRTTNRRVAGGNGSGMSYN
jgi:hypothetical protein